MVQSQGEKRGYQRGYQRAQRNEWPIPSSIPDARYAKLVALAKELSDRADAFMAHFDDRNTEPSMMALDAARDSIIDEICETRNESLGPEVVDGDS